MQPVAFPELPCWTLPARDYTVCHNLIPDWIARDTTFFLIIENLKLVSATHLTMSDKQFVFIKDKNMYINSNHIRYIKHDDVKSCFRLSYNDGYTFAGTSSGDYNI